MADDWPAVALRRVGLCSAARSRPLTEAEAAELAGLDARVRAHLEELYPRVYAPAGTLAATKGGE